MPHQTVTPSQFNGVFLSPLKTSRQPASRLAPMGKVEECLIMYQPQPIVTSYSANLLGPPVDILRKVVDVSKATISEKNKVARKARVEVTSTSRFRRWWVVLCDLKLYFYETYGDSRPKFVGDIAEATATLSSGVTSKITLVHADMHVWTLEFPVDEDAVKFFFAIQESTKALTSSSMYVKSSDLPQGRTRQYGF